MVYDWKTPGIYKMDAQVAGEALEEIYQKRGRLDAADIVDESRPEDAPLHSCFEWDDPKAAELYREEQARCLVRCITTVKETGEEKEVTVRAFHHVEGTYTPLTVILQDSDKTAEMKETAMRELRAFQEKWAVISEVAEGLSPVFEAITTVLNKEKTK